MICNVIQQLLQVLRLSSLKVCSCIFEFVFNIDFDTLQVLQPMLVPTNTIRNAIEIAVFKVE